EQTGKLKTPSTATSYAWFVWTKGHKGATAVNWIPPCREELEREGDYGEPRHIADIAGPVIERTIREGACK
ncbi:MAG: hypothetical protein GY862_13025, partial [Gammaproteobacteria bacterium]|nr:hypothetical protein [Gammaproteobacteria bacterium]